MEELKEIASKIKTLDELKEFIYEYKLSNWFAMIHVIPTIVENLSYQIDIENNLKEWETLILILIGVEGFHNSKVLEKLLYYYPNYPIECLFEAIETYSGRRYYPAIVWYEPMLYVYKKYAHKMDKHLFDKYVFMVNNSDEYFIILLAQNDFDIPTNSIYSDLDRLFKSRQEGGKPYPIIEEAISKNINKFHMFAPENVFTKMKEVLKKTILEDEGYKEIQKGMNVAWNVDGDGEYTFDEFLVAEWGIVKYMSHLYQYSDMSQEDKQLYKRFIISLIPESLDNHNLRALAKIQELIQLFDNSIPTDTLTNILINRPLWKKEQEFQTIFEEMKSLATKCFDEFGDDAPYIGDFGTVYITFQNKKGFSLWLLVNGYAKYDDFNKKVILYESSLGIKNIGHATRAESALKCASKILEENKIACSVGVWMN